MAIDTLAFAKHLERAGIDRNLAEAHAEAMSNHVFPQLATKADLDRIASDITLRVILATLAIAGLAIAVAKIVL